MRARELSGTYGELYQYLLEAHDVLPLGLYRRDTGVIAGDFDLGAEEARDAGAHEAERAAERSGSSAQRARVSAPPTPAEGTPTRGAAEGAGAGAGGSAHVSPAAATSARAAGPLGAPPASPRARGGGMDSDDERKSPMPQAARVDADRDTGRDTPERSSHPASRASSLTASSRASPRPPRGAGAGSKPPAPPARAGSSRRVSSGSVNLNPPRRGSRTVDAKAAASAAAASTPDPTESPDKLRRERVLDLWRKVRSHFWKGTFRTGFAQFGDDGELSPGATPRRADGAESAFFPATEMAVLSNPPSDWLVRPNDEIFVLLRNSDALYNPSARSVASMRGSGAEGGVAPGLAPDVVVLGQRATHKLPNVSAFLRERDTMPRLGVDEGFIDANTAMLTRLREIEQSITEKVDRLVSVHTRGEARLAAMEEDIATVKRSLHTLAGGAGEAARGSGAESVTLGKPDL